jgi:hypothetical protein
MEVIVVLFKLPTQKAPGETLESYGNLKQLITGSLLMSGPLQHEAT